MKLTGKAKEKFEKWYSYNVYSETSHLLGISDFYTLPLSMQWGVLLDFFDSERIYIDVFKVYGYYIFSYHIDSTLHTNDIKTRNRQQAQIKAIEQANEILNSRL